MKKLAILAVLILCAVGADARSHRRSSKYNAAGAPGAFDYYVLSLSWAPDFCDQSGQMNNRECGTGNHVGFIVHGLWPQFNNGGFPKQCAPASPVASDIVNRMLPIMMDAGLIQHEWRDHEQREHEWRHHEAFDREQRERQRWEFRQAPPFMVLPGYGAYPPPPGYYGNPGYVR